MAEQEHPPLMPVFIRLVRKLFHRVIDRWQSIFTCGQQKALNSSKRAKLGLSNDKRRTNDVRALTRVHHFSLGLKF